MVKKSVINDCVNEIFSDLDSEDKLLICTYLSSELDDSKDNRLFVEIIEDAKGSKVGIKLGVTDNNVEKFSFKSNVYNPDALIHSAIMIQNNNV